MNAAKRYTSLQDLKSIVELGLTEDLRLEYKASKIVEKSDTNAICKTVSAFANSVGGQFVVGIRVDGNSGPVLDGGVSGSSRQDWLHKIINAGTHPPVDGIEIVELPVDTGAYYIVSVPASRQAPHQASDRLYYKRRGTHSEPMEHYEVEDVRNRPKTDLTGLDLTLWKEDSVAYLRFRNATRSEDVTNIRCEIASNVEFEREGLDVLSTAGIRRLPPGEELYFCIAGIGILLGKRSDAEISVATTYTFRGDILTDRQTFYFTHYRHSIIIREPTQQALLNIEEQLKAIAKQLDVFGRRASRLDAITDASGLRLSQRTLASLRGEGQRCDPREYDVGGYKMILDVSWEEAFALSGIFHTWISGEHAKREYEALNEDLRQKFETHFLPTFEKA